LFKGAFSVTNFSSLFSNSKKTFRRAVVVVLNASRGRRVDDDDAIPRQRSFCGVFLPATRTTTTTTTPGRIAAHLRGDTILSRFGTTEHKH